MSSSGVASGWCSTWMAASITSPMLCGGTLVAMPTAMPWDPLTRRLGNRPGSTTGSCDGAVVVGHQVDGLFVDVGHELQRQRSQPAFGVAHGRGAVVGAAAAEAAVAVDQRVAERELLDHAGQRLVDRRVAVRVVRPHDLAHDLGALAVRPVGTLPVVEHGVEDPAMYRLESVAHVGQGPGDDDGHGVLEERALHLLLDLDGLDGAADGLVPGGRRTASRRTRTPAARAACRLVACVPTPRPLDQMSRNRTSLALVWMK